MSCKQRGKVKKRKVKIRCKVRAAGSSTASASLLRNGAVVATGPLRRGRFSATLAARSRRAARSGRYTLVITSGRGKGAKVTVEPVAMR